MDNGDLFKMDSRGQFQMDGRGQRGLDFPLMAFQRAILPAVLSWADKLVMIGKYWNTYLIACQCYIYYIAYTGAPS